MSNIRSTRPARNGRPMQRRNGSSGGSNSGSNNGRRPSNGGRRNGENISIGNATSHREKYLEKAKEALSYGDRVLAENFFQHADHYNRIVIAAEERRQYDDANSRSYASEDTAEATDNVEGNTANEERISPAYGNSLDTVDDSIGNMPEDAIA
jgi:hypothetical protein